VGANTRGQKTVRWGRQEEGLENRSGLQTVDARVRGRRSGTGAWGKNWGKGANFPNKDRHWGGHFKRREEKAKGKPGNAEGGGGVDAPNSGEANSVDREPKQGRWGEKK